MNRFWSPLVHSLTPYTPGEQPKLNNLIKLNTNEHPYGPSPRVLDAIRNENTSALRLYPDPESTRLKMVLATHHQVSPEQVFLGNGSDEVLAFTFMALLNHTRPLWFPDITYSFYPVYCQLYGIQYRTIPLDDTFAIRPHDYMPGEDEQAGAIIFPNPNAPTGRLLSLSDIATIATANPDAVVVIDEAYIDFGGESALSLISHHTNLMVIQTFSKSRSLAGMRIGYAIGHPTLIEALERVKNSFNSYPLDRLAQAAAVASLEDSTYFKANCKKIISTRTQLTEDLTALGFDVLPSAANFVFARHPDHDAAALATALREKSIIVRHFRQPRIEQFLRITIGTSEQCHQLVVALQQILTPAA